MPFLVCRVRELVRFLVLVRVRPGFRGCCGSEHTEVSVGFLIIVIIVAALMMIATVAFLLARHQRWILRYRLL